MHEDEPIDDREYIYATAFWGLTRIGTEKKAPYSGMTQILSKYKTNDLGALFKAQADTDLPQKKPTIEASQKLANLIHENADAPLVVAIHGLAIAGLRRHPKNPEAARVFFKLWEDHGAKLVEVLSPRWRLSAVDTFAEVGETADQRQAAAMLSLFFRMSKLYEFERSFTGQPAASPFRFGKRNRTPLPFGMTTYSIQKGDLDRNMMRDLWNVSERDAVFRPLGCGLLLDVLREKSGLLYRLLKMREAMKKRAENSTRS